jgi:hypothetical protein
VLSCGECLPATGFADWPTGGTYGMISGTALHDQLGEGRLPVLPALDRGTFPVLFGPALKPAVALIQGALPRELGENQRDKTNVRLAMYEGG